MRNLSADFCNGMKVSASFQHTVQIKTIQSECFSRRGHKCVTFLPTMPVLMSYFSCEKLPYVKNKHRLEVSQLTAHTSSKLHLDFTIKACLFPVPLRGRPRAVRADHSKAGPQQLQQPHGGCLCPAHVHHGENQHLHQVRSLYCVFISVP